MYDYIMFMVTECSHGGSIFTNEFIKGWAAACLVSGTISNKQFLKITKEIDGGK